LRINDISVSRCHAIIKFKVDQPTTEGTANRFYLEDNLSKFGTLVLIRRRTPLIPGYNKAVQIGRTVINFSVKAISSGSHSGANAAGLQGLVKGKIEEAN
jgi:FHA domain